MINHLIISLVTQLWYVNNNAYYATANVTTVVSHDIVLEWTKVCSMDSL